MKKIAFFTTTRAEFGIISALIKEIERDNLLKYLLFVGGMHLADEYGNTVQEIQSYKFKISGYFDYLLNQDQPESLAKSLGIATLEIAKIFKDFEFDFACVLGDRFELLAVASNAILFNKPIIHLHGGERTEGAIDEQIRHMITKAAHLHFVSCEEYKKNVHNMAEPSDRIFNTGALSVDNIINQKNISKIKLFKMLKLKANLPTVLMTYHPVTLELNISPLEQIQNVFKAINKFGFQVVITSPNIDTNRHLIVEQIEKEVKNNSDFHYIESLGMQNYISMIPHCCFVIGNSSSGIIEVPYFKIPTINIGDRQSGRIQHESIINTDYSTKSIIDAINKAESKGFRQRLKNMNFKFGNGTAAKQMVEVIKSLKTDQSFLIKRSGLREN